MEPLLIGTRQGLDTRLCLPNAAGCRSVVAVTGDGVRFPPAVPSPERDEPIGEGPLSLSAVNAGLFRIPSTVFPPTTFPSASGVAGSSWMPGGFSATDDNGPCISCPSSSVLGLMSVSSPSSSGVEQLGGTPSPAVLDPGLTKSVVERDRVAEMLAAEYGADESGVESCRTEGELKTGPFSMDSSGGGSFPAAAKPTPSQCLRLRRMKTAMRAMMRRTPNTEPTTIPAMAPPLRPELLPPEGGFLPLPLPGPVELESLGGMATTFPLAPWFHVHADTLKTFRS